MASVVATITSLLCVLAIIDHPFHDGPGGLQPVAMQRVLKNLDHTLQRQGRRPSVRRGRRRGSRAADVNWLVSAPLWVLLIGWLAVTVAAAVLGHLFVSHVVHSHDRDEVRGLANPMMPAFGAMFAVLTAITLSSEAGYLKSAQDGVAEEAASASRLAWAATNPNVDAAADPRRAWSGTWWRFGRTSGRARRGSDR